MATRPTPTRLRGASFLLYIRENGPDDPPLRAPLSFTIAGMGPHTLGLEAEEEMRALCDQFRLLVDDPQIDGMGKGEFSTERFLAGFAAYNRLAHQVAIQALDQRPATLAKERLEAAWRWNRERDALADRSGDSLYVPSVLFAEGKEPHSVETFVAWLEGIPARVPEVDAIQGALGRIAWKEIGPALELAKREDDPLPHYLFEGDAVARVAAAIERAPKGKKPPRLISPGAVSTAELVAEIVAPKSGGNGAGGGDDAAKQARAQKAFETAVTAHMGNRPREAFEAAVEAATLNPALQTACLLAAANGLYLAKSAEALAWAEKYLEPSPDDKQGHLIRGVALTELARYDEALAALDRSVGDEYDPMNGNCRAYALAGAGRDALAREEYEKALASLDEKLEDKDVGDKADLLARRSYSLAGLGRYAEALEDAEKAIALDGANFLALQDGARAAVELGKWKETIDFARRAREVREVAPEAAFFAARAHAALGDGAAAKAELALVTTEHLRRKAAADPALAGLLGKGGATKAKAGAKKPAIAKRAKAAAKKPAAKKKAVAKRKPAAKAKKAPAKKPAKKPAAKAKKKKR